MAGLSFKVEGISVDLNRVNPNDPIWLSMYWLRHEETSRPALVVTAEECPEPKKVRVTAADCELSRVVTSSSGVHFNPRGH